MGPKVKCLNCGEIIQSMHRHDFVPCSCWKNIPDTTGICVDGGADYCRIVFSINSSYEILEEEGKE